MHLPFLALHQEGKLPARLRINFLHQDTTADLPTLTERLKNSYKFFGDDVVRTGGIGEFIGGGTGANNISLWKPRSGSRAQAGAPRFTR